MPGKISQTVQFNGAEYLDLLAQAGKIGLTPPAFVLVRCGIETWREEAARGRSTPPPPRGQPVRLALERRSVTIRLTPEAHDQLRGEACQAGTSMPQYIRTRCGFKVRNTSLPNTDEREDEEDEAWQILKGLGLNPQEYFPPEA